MGNEAASLHNVNADGEPVGEDTKSPNNAPSSPSSSPTIPTNLEDAVSTLLGSMTGRSRSIVQSSSELQSNEITRHDNPYSREYENEEEAEASFEIEQDTLLVSFEEGGNCISSEHLLTPKSTPTVNSEDEADHPISIVTSDMEETELVFADALNENAPSSCNSQSEEGNDDDFIVSFKEAMASKSSLEHDQNDDEGDNISQKALHEQTDDARSVQSEATTNTASKEGESESGSLLVSFEEAAKVRSPSSRDNANTLRELQPPSIPNALEQLEDAISSFVNPKDGSNTEFDAKGLPENFLAPPINLTVEPARSVYDEQGDAAYSISMEASKNVTEPQPPDMRELQPPSIPNALVQLDDATSILVQSEDASNNDFDAKSLQETFLAPPIYLTVEPARSVDNKRGDTSISMAASKDLREPQPPSIPNSLAQLEDAISSLVQSDDVSHTEFDAKDSPENFLAPPIDLTVEPLSNVEEKQGVKAYSISMEASNVTEPHPPSISNSLAQLEDAIASLVQRDDVSNTEFDANGLRDNVLAPPIDHTIEQTSSVDDGRGDTAYSISIEASGDVREKQPHSTPNALAPLEDAISSPINREAVSITDFDAKDLPADVLAPPIDQTVEPLSSVEDDQGDRDYSISMEASGDVREPQPPSIPNAPAQSEDVISSPVKREGVSNTDFGAENSPGNFFSTPINLTVEPASSSVQDEQGDTAYSISMEASCDVRGPQPPSIPNALAQSEDVISSHVEREGVSNTDFGAKTFPGNLTVEPASSVQDEQGDTAYSISMEASNVQKPSSKESTSLSDQFHEDDRIGRQIGEEDDQSDDANPSSSLLPLHAEEASTQQSQETVPGEELLSSLSSFEQTVDLTNKLELEQEQMSLEMARLEKAILMHSTLQTGQPNNTNTTTLNDSLNISLHEIFKPTTTCKSANSPTGDDTDFASTKTHSLAEDQLQDKRVQRDICEADKALKDGKESSSPVALQDAVCMNGMVSADESECEQICRESTNEEASPLVEAFVVVDGALSDEAFINIPRVHDSLDRTVGPNSNESAVLECRIQSAVTAAVDGEERTSEISTIAAPLEEASLLDSTLPEKETETLTENEHRRANEANAMEPKCSDVREANNSIGDSSTADILVVAIASSKRDGSGRHDYANLNQNETDVPYSPLPQTEIKHDIHVRGIISHQHSIPHSNESPQDQLWVDPVVKAAAVGAAARQAKQAQQQRPSLFASFWGKPEDSDMNDWKRSLHRLASTAASTVSIVANAATPVLIDAGAVVTHSAETFADALRKEFQEPPHYIKPDKLVEEDEAVEEENPNEALNAWEPSLTTAETPHAPSVKVSDDPLSPAPMLPLKPRTQGRAPTYSALFACDVSFKHSAAKPNPNSLSPALSGVETSGACTPVSGLSLSDLPTVRYLDPSSTSTPRTSWRQDLTDAPAHFMDVVSKLSENQVALGLLHSLKHAALQTMHPDENVVDGEQLFHPSQSVFARERLPPTEESSASSLSLPETPVPSDDSSSDSDSVSNARLPFWDMISQNNVSFQLRGNEENVSVALLLPHPDFTRTKHESITKVNMQPDFIHSKSKTSLDESTVEIISSDLVTDEVATQRASSVLHAVLPKRSLVTRPPTRQQNELATAGVIQQRSSISSAPSRFDIPTPRQSLALSEPEISARLNRLSRSTSSPSVNATTRQSRRWSPPTWTEEGSIASVPTRMGSLSGGSVQFSLDTQKVRRRPLVLPGESSLQGGGSVSSRRKTKQRRSSSRRPPMARIMSWRVLPSPFHSSPSGQRPDSLPSALPPSLRFAPGDPFPALMAIRSADCADDSSLLQTDASVGGHVSEPDWGRTIHGYPLSDSDDEGESPTHKEFALDQALIDFLSLQTLGFHRDFVKPKLPQSLEYMASVRWQCLVANWKHQETSKLLTTRPCSQHASPKKHESSLQECDESSGSSTVISLRSKSSVYQNLTRHSESPGVEYREGVRHHEWLENGAALTSFLCSLGLPGSVEDNELRHSLTTSNSNIELDDLVEAAEAAVPSFVQLLGKIVSFASLNDCQLTYSVDVKCRSQIHRKSLYKYKGDLARVKDVLRAEITCPNEGSLVCALLCLSKHCGGAKNPGLANEVNTNQIVRIKNLFLTDLRGKLCPSPLPTGYRHVLVNIRLQSGILAEIQFQLRSLFCVLGFDGYSLHRELVDIEFALRQGQTPTTNCFVGAARFSELIKQSLSVTASIRTLRGSNTKPTDGNINTAMRTKHLPDSKFPIAAGLTPTRRGRSSIPPDPRSLHVDAFSRDANETMSSRRSSQGLQRKLSSNEIRLLESVDEAASNVDDATFNIENRQPIRTRNALFSNRQVLQLDFNPTSSEPLSPAGAIGDGASVAVGDGASVASGLSPYHRRASVGLQPNFAPGTIPQDDIISEKEKEVCNDSTSNDNASDIALVTSLVPQNPGQATTQPQEQDHFPESRGPIAVGGIAAIAAAAARSRQLRSCVELPVEPTTIQVPTASFGPVAGGGSAGIAAAAAVSRQLHSSVDLPVEPTSNEKLMQTLGPINGGGIATLAAAAAKSRQLQSSVELTVETNPETEPAESLESVAGGGIAAIATASGSRQLRSSVKTQPEDEPAESPGLIVSGGIAAIAAAAARSRQLRSSIQPTVETQTEGEPVESPRVISGDGVATIAAARLHQLKSIVEFPDEAKAEDEKAESPESVALEAIAADAADAAKSIQRRSSSGLLPVTMVVEDELNAYSQEPIAGGGTAAFWAAAARSSHRRSSVGLARVDDRARATSIFQHDYSVGLTTTANVSTGGSEMSTATFGPISNNYADPELGREKSGCEPPSPLQGESCSASLAVSPRMTPSEAATPVHGNRFFAEDTPDSNLLDQRRGHVPNCPNNEGFSGILQQLRQDFIHFSDDEVFLALTSAAVEDASRNPRDVPTFHVLYMLSRYCEDHKRSDMAVSQIEENASHVEPTTSKEAESVRDFLQSIQLVALTRNLTIAYQATSTGMTGWLEYGSINPLDRTKERPFDVLHRIGSHFARRGSWEAALDVFQFLVSRCEHHLPLHHPLTLTSMLDLAAALHMNSKTDSTKKILRLASERLRRYLSEQELYCGATEHPVHTSSVVSAGNITGVAFLRSFTSLLHDLMDRELIAVIGDDHEIALANRCFVADSYAVLANCSQTIGSESPASVNESRQLWSTACRMYRGAFKGWIKTRPLRHPNVAATACSVARCYRELGKREAAMDILTSVVNSFNKTPNPNNSDVPPTTPDPPLPIICFFSQKHFVPFAESSNPETKAGGEQVLSLCLWNLAVLFVETNPNERGRIRALSLLHAASEALQRAITYTDRDSATTKTSLSMLHVVENEAKELFATLEAAINNSCPHPHKPTVRDGAMC